MVRKQRQPRRTGRWPSAPHNDSGVVLPAVMILACILLIFVLSVFQFSALDAGLATHEVRRSQALYLAEGGLERGQTWLEAQPDPPAGADTLYPAGFMPSQFAGGSALHWIVPAPGGGGAYTIVSEATVGTHTRRLEADVTAGVFTDFLYFTNTEHMPGGGNPLWFTTGDVVDGPMFTNDQISIFGDPRFLSGVASAYGGPGDNNSNHNAAFYYHNGSGTPFESTADNNAPQDNPYFADGYQLGSSAVIYPRLPSVFDFRTLSRNGGIDLAGSYEVVFARPHPTTGQPMYGYVSYRKSGRAWTDTPIASTNGIMFVNGGISVSGVVDGRMTVVTNGAITIVDDVRYRASDANGPLGSCDDMLGLLSGGDINVADNAANRSDCVIHAAMMALCNSFRVDNWNIGSPRGSLTVWGSIVQAFRGSVGTGTLVDRDVVILTGYAKDYHYDWRLQEEYPPGFYRFLKTGMFKRIAWREVPQDELGHTPTHSSG
jgi:hypothetical protein